jgi:hypothetical protein
MHNNYKQYSNKSKPFLEQTKEVLEEQAWGQWVDNPTTKVFLSLLRQERERLVKDVSYLAVKRTVADGDVRIVAAQIKTLDEIIQTIHDKDRYKNSGSNRPRV